MSLNLVVFVLLVVSAICEYREGETKKKLYWISFGVLAAMLCFRYGQGTDYYGYYYNFLMTPSLLDFEALLNTGIHGEVGWLLISSIFRTLGIPFGVLVFLVSVVEMYCLHRFISKYSPLWTVSLLLIYPTLYLTYAMSAVRQGLVMMIFLGFMIEWLYQGKMKNYLITTFLCALIHSSSLVFLVLFVIRVFELNTKKALLLMGVCVIGGFAASQILAKLSSAIAYYADSGMSLAAIAERVVSTGLVLYVFRNELDHTKRKGKLTFLLQIYLYGSIIYSFLMWSSLISSRFAVYFKAVEVALFAVAVKKKHKMRELVALYLLGLTTIMYFKNINSYIGQGNYLDHVNVWNYPYISIFAKDTVESWRTIPYDFTSLLG